MIKKTGPTENLSSLMVLLQSIRHYNPESFRAFFAAFLREFLDLPNALQEVAANTDLGGLAAIDKLTESFMHSIVEFIRDQDELQKPKHLTDVQKRLLVKFHFCDLLHASVDPGETKNVTDIVKFVMQFHSPGAPKDSGTPQCSKRRTPKQRHR